MRKTTLPHSDVAAWQRSSRSFSHLALVFALIMIVATIMIQLTSRSPVWAMSDTEALQTRSGQTDPVTPGGTPGPESSALTGTGTWRVFAPIIVAPQHTPTPSGDVQPSFPLRAAFYYPWFPQAWTQLGIYPYTNYQPDLDFYDGSNATVIAKHIADMQYGGIKAGILSWWGQGDHTDTRVGQILNTTTAAHSTFRWGIYYEPESQGDPSVSTLHSDLLYLHDHYGSDPSFLRIDGRFVVFVYADAADACGMADRWTQANAGVNAYLVLKVFPGYAQCPSQPAGWHQYAPAAAADSQGSLSYTISPGFWKVGEAVRLARDPARWRQNVRDMVASGANFQLITTFNEWGEGTSVEPASQWTSPSGYGVYLEALHDNGAEPPVGTPTKTPPPSSTPTKTPTKSPTKTAPPSRTPTKTPTATPTATRTVTPSPTAPGAPTATPSACSTTTLTKGPTLILTGNNTQMKVFWQWSATASFTLRWGTDTRYSAGSASVSQYDSTNHLYAYTINGLTPGAKYEYQVQVGSQCAASSFYAPPASSATNVKFFSYGDTRTNGSAHNGLAGQIVSLFQSDPAFQTLNLNVGDWVSGDSESAWTGEWFNTGYTNIRKEDASIADNGVRGNHEGSATYWKRYFPQVFQPGGLYWSFDYGPMHIAMLDQYTSYSPGSTQYNWLQNDLAASTKTWKFVVLHEPGWSAGGGHGNNTAVQNNLEPLFRQYGVSIVFGGHNHYYARAVVDGIQHLTVGGGGAPSYTPDSSYPNIVVIDSGYSFGEFTIAGNKLDAKIVDNSGKTVDSFSLTR